MCIPADDYRLVFFLRLGVDLQQHGGKVGVGELEVPLVVELEECWRVGVVLLKMKVVDLWLLCRAAAVFTDIHLGGETVST